MKKVKCWTVMAVVGALLMTSVRGSFDAFTSYAEETVISSENASSAASDASTVVSDAATESSSQEVIGDSSVEGETVVEEKVTEETVVEEKVTEETVVEETVTEAQTDTSFVESESSYDTSYDLKNFLEYGYVVYDGEEIGLSEFSFTPGETYTLVLGFAENNELQFGTLDGTNYLYYELPSGIVPESSGIGGRFSINLKNESAEYVLTDNNYYFDDNTLRVVFNTESTVGDIRLYDILQDTTDVEFSLEFNITVNEDATEISFSDSITGTVVEADPTEDDPATENPEVVETEDEEEEVTVTEVSISKKYAGISDDNSVVTWQIEVVVPATGLAELSIKDVIPYRYINKVKYQDSFGEITSVTGLQDSETYDISIDKNGNPTISFYKNEDMSSTGLLESDEDRTIVIELTTFVNQEWVELGVEKHTNKATVSSKLTEVSGEKTAEASAYVNINKNTKSISKAYRSKTGTKSDGSVWYEYSVIISGVNDDSFTVADYYNIDIFDLDKSSIKVTAGNSSSSAGAAVIGTITSENITATDEIASSDYEEATGHVDITVSNLSNSYKYYKLVYKLVVPADKISALEEIANNSTITVDGVEVPGTTITNIAVWDNLEAYDTNAVYRYKGVEKELSQDPIASNNYTATYSISINPSAMDLNKGGDKLTLKDEASNLSYDLSSIVILDADNNDITDECEISLDESGYLTIIIPDETALTITYDAMVVESGEYTNTVSP